MSAPSDSLGKDARALLRAARGGDDVPPEERHRLLETFARQRAADDARAQRALAPIAGRSRRAAPRLGWAVAALVLTGSLAALARHQGFFQRLGAWIESAAPPPSSLESRQPAPPPRRPQPAPPLPSSPLPSSAVTDEELSPEAAPVLEPAEPLAPRTAVPEPAQRTGARRAPVTARAQLAAPDAIDPEELELIAAARTALAERQHDAARQHAERHAVRFPRGAFSEEREAILALSDCRSQRGSQRGQRFLSERPASLLAERVRRDCGLSANPVSGAREPGTH